MNSKINTSEKIGIWIIEDNLHFQKTISDFINESSRFQSCCTFTSCEEAIDRLNNQMEPPQVILLDIGLEGMSGIEGVKLFKEISPSTSIIMLTIYEDDNSVFEALCAGASGYLLKDSEPGKILDAIEEVIAGGAPMNPQIARKVIEMFKQFNPPKVNYGLTKREKEILSYIVSGLSSKKIAEKLFVSYHTVNTHIKNIYEKLHVNSKSGVVSKAIKEKLI